MSGKSSSGSMDDSSKKIPERKPASGRLQIRLPVNANKQRSDPNTAKIDLKESSSAPVVKTEENNSTKSSGNAVSSEGRSSTKREQAHTGGIATAPKRLRVNVSSANSSKSTTPAPTPTQQSVTGKVPKMPHYTPKAKPSNVKEAFSQVDQIHLHHQSTSIHFVYNRNTCKSNNGHNEIDSERHGGWSYQGTTTLYLSHTPESQISSTLGGGTHRREVALHLRGSSSLNITNATVHLPLPSVSSEPQNNQQQHVKPSITLRPMRATLVSHHDPISKIFTKPAATFTPLDFLALNPTRRYEADTHCLRGGDGMMEGMRCASIASNYGELRIEFVCPSVKVGSKEVLKQLWKHELSSIGSKSHSDVGNNGATGEEEIARDLMEISNERGGKRRLDRIELIADRLSSDNLVDKTSPEAPGSKSPNGINSGVQSKAKNSTVNATMGFKIVIHFHMDVINDESFHFGGIHFKAPIGVDGATRSPHVYTTSGVLGDHQGPRSWVPTIDSASSKHRATHDLTIKVTADCREGLWAAGCGEHFGVNRTILHYAPENKANANINIVAPSLSSEANMEKKLTKYLGKASVDFIAKSFESSNLKLNAIDNAIRDKRNDGVHVIPQEIPEGSIGKSRICLATNIWTTSIWNPCPSRSLGFAIGPFNISYDPEYYSQHDYEDDEDEEDESKEEDEEEDDYPTIEETAEKRGEGIRQLYFAMRAERRLIHSGAKLIDIDGNVMLFAPAPAPHSDSFDCEDRKKLLMSITGSTAGVPNRALSLMRDILALPSYRTTSITQIWIPHCVDGGLSSGALHACPEISCNPFLGGAIFDSSLLPPPGYRLPFYSGGRELQLLQARCAVRGWITASLPLGETDDVGHSYIHSLFEHFIMGLYERAHGGFGEGGSKHSFYFCKRYAVGCGLNSRCMDFLPLNNVEEDDMMYGISHGISTLGALPDEDRSKEELWRNATNGSESHTSSIDEFSVRELLTKDVLEGIERIDKSLPSMGWRGSLLSATFLTSNSSSSSKVGCGAVELMHPIGGTVYRDLKCRSLRKIIEGRIGVSNFVRVLRVAFVASILEDKGLTRVELPPEKPSKGKDYRDKKKSDTMESEIPKPLFVQCVDEIIRKGGFAHGSFVRTMRFLSGPVREGYLRGMLVDVSSDTYGTMPSQPEGFPNSYVRGCSGLYLRVGVHVEHVVVGEQQSSKSNQLQAQILAEPVIPEGGISFGGPVTIRIIERGGQCREFVKSIASNGSRTDWGPIFLHGEPVTSAKKQAAASGTIETAMKKSSGNNKAKGEKEAVKEKRSLLGSASISTNSSFDENQLHRGGYQALEIVRLTNRTPLLWVRVDPHNLFDGRIALFQQDACLGEQLFHDGDAQGQIEASRALAERPLRLQTSKVKSLHGVSVSELPVRLLADCLRGTAALHADLPHNPTIRVQAALAIAQWQNNQAPVTKDTVGWTGLQLLVQYLDERFLKDGSILSAPKYSRICCRMEVARKGQGNTSSEQSEDPNEYQYLDSFAKAEDRITVINDSVSIEREEDEEYRVRSAVVTAIATIRAKDGLTPTSVIKVLEKILQGNDESISVNWESIEEGRCIREKRQKRKSQEGREDHKYDATMEKWISDISELPYQCSSLIADALLALCYINARPDLVDDPVTGKQVQSKAKHPCVPLMEICYRWLEWDLYKETLRIENEMEKMSISGRSVIAPCAITALCSLALLRQCTTDSSVDKSSHANRGQASKSEQSKIIDDASNPQFYIDIFDSRPPRNDAIRAAAAQAVLCLCCAIDRTEHPEPVGLLNGLEFTLKRMLEPTTSPGLRHTLALLMLDACTGKICSTHRVAMVSRENDLIAVGSKLYNGPLGASYGSDNGASLHTTISESLMPAADAVNDGARRGLRLLKQAGGTGQKISAGEGTVVRVARFATQLWRTLNGEMGGIEKFKGNCGDTIPITSAVDGICAHDGNLRCIILSLWQWIWPKGAIPVLRVQTWKEHEGTVRYKNLGADEVMKVEDSEKNAVSAGESVCSGLRKIITSEIDRQKWRGEMAKARREEIVSSKDSVTNTQGVNCPLHIVQKDLAWKHGGWVASAAQQRRHKGADGGSSVAVTKFRLSMNKGGD